jgi:hypothetical protein
MFKGKCRNFIPVNINLFHALGKWSAAGSAAWIRGGFRTREIR